MTHEWLSARSRPWSPLFHEEFAGFSSIAPYWQQIMSSFTTDFPHVDDFNALRTQHSFTFVTQTKDMKYDAEILELNRIPMRPNSWHDFFNNLTWLLWPQLKRSIMERIGIEIRRRTSNARTARQDLLTHLDECGIVLCSSRDEIFDDVNNHSWKKLFFDTKDLLMTCEALIIGHGIFEKALSPYIGMTAKAIFISVQPDFFSKPYEEKMRFIDNYLAAYVVSEDFPESPKSLAPFPLLGWPGWWPANEDEAFFNNEKYFRKK